MSKTREIDTGEIDWVWPITGYLFLKNGATVVILDIDDKKAKEEIDQWTSQGFPCYYFKVNTAHYNEVLGVAEQIINGVPSQDPCSGVLHCPTR